MTQNYQNKFNPIDNLQITGSEAEIGDPFLIKIANESYDDYIYEINIILCSVIRWSSSTRTSTVERTIAKWILSRKNKSHLDTQYDPLIKLLTSRIFNSTSNVTKLKACIRTLLRSSRQRRHELIEFILEEIASQEHKQEASKILIDDLLHDRLELGYPIPIIETPMTNDKIKTYTPRQLAYEYSLDNTVIVVATMINDQIYSIFEHDLYTKVKKRLNDTISRNCIYISDQDINDNITKGIISGLKYFGITLNIDYANLGKSKNNMISLE